jgi:hypothetical protein
MVDIINISTSRRQAPTLKATAAQEGATVRRCLKEAEAQSYEPEPVPDLIQETETAYKAQSPGKLAPFDSAQGALSLPNGHNTTKPRVQGIG